MRVNSDGCSTARLQSLTDRSMKSVDDPTLARNALVDLTVHDDGAKIAQGPTGLNATSCSRDTIG